MQLPRHLAIIMDGNGRWAERKKKPRHYGHIRGTQVAKGIIQDCARLGVPFLTLYAFSTENWHRPQLEVSLLMRLLKKFLSRELATLVKENIRFNVIGNTKSLPLEIQDIITEAKLKTSGCTGMTLTFALSYGSRQEITQAARELAQKALEGTIRPSDITEELLSQTLQTNTLPDPDLILRTSGEMRISNFLLWQSAYSEFYFSEKYWPDFTKSDLVQALTEFQVRERRFGRTQNLVNHEQLSH